MNFEAATPPRPPRSIRWTAAVFSFLALAHFPLFILLHPIDWQQPETLRMRYFSLQAGVREGPLTSRPTPADLLKPLSNLARGGGYEARYLAKLIDGLQAKLWVQVYPLTGPFLGEPINVLLLLLTGFFVFLAAREWFGCPPAALTAVGFWFFTSQVLLDSRYPIRPNMLLSAVFSVYMLWELLRWRRTGGGSGPLIRLGLSFFLALTCQEFVLFSLFPMAVVALRYRRAYGTRRLVRLAATLGGAILAYAVFFQFAYPWAMRRLIGEEPLTMWLGDNSPLELLHPPILLARLRDFTLDGIRYYLGENWGLDPAAPYWTLVPAGVGALLVLAAGLAYWRRVWVPLAGAFLFFLAVSLVMFPYVPGSVEMPVYYYTLPVIWSIFPLAAVLAEIVRKDRRCLWIAVLTGLLMVAEANIIRSARTMEVMPSYFGYTPQVKEYVRDILNLRRYIRAAEIPEPVYLSYPRPRRFDVSTRWDIMLRVWNKEADQVFSMMLPVLHLKDFETRNLLGNREEFVETAALAPDEYEARSAALADMPRRGWYDLQAFRGTAANPDQVPVWRSEAGESVAGRKDRTPFGEAYRTVLPAGTWRTTLRWRDGLPVPVRLALLARADLQPPGAEEVWYRTSPLAGGRCLFTLNDGVNRIRRQHSYGWSFQLQEWSPAVSNPAGEVELEVRSEGETEIVGPVAVPSGTLKLHSWPGPGDAAASGL